MRLDDRVAFKVAVRAVDNFSVNTLSNGPLLSMGELLGRYLQSKASCIKSAKKIAEKVAIAARPKTILAKVESIPETFVGVKLFKLIKTSPYIAKANADASGSVSLQCMRKVVADSEGLTLVKIMHSTYLFQLPHERNIKSTEVMGYITRHAIERFFKRAGTTKQSDFEREIRESTNGFLLANATALVRRDMKQVWAVTKTGLFVGFAERDEKGFCWVTYTTFVDKNWLSGRWVGAHRLSQRFMGSTTFDACSHDGVDLCYESLIHLMGWYEMLKEGDPEDGDRVLETLNLMNEHPLLVEMDRFIENNAWVTRDHFDIACPNDAAWNDVNRYGELTSEGMGA